MIQIFSNSLGDEEAAAVRDVFESKWLGRGKECERFEEELSAFYGVPQTLLLNCATAAINIALKALGIGKGDEVIIPTANFVAIPSAVVGLGAKPVFADVDPAFFNLLPLEIERLRTPKTKAVFLLHYGGHPAAFDEIRAACGDEILIMEDSANAVASLYKGRRCGTLGDAGVFSFDAMKTLVMGDGGALILLHQAARGGAECLRYLGYAAHSTSGQEALKAGHKRWWEYDLECTAGRYVSNDILAAIGRIQLQKLPQFIARRREVWDYYQEHLRDIDGIILPPEPLPATESSYYLYWLRVPGRRDALAEYLKQKGIYTTFRYFPLHKVQFFEDSSHLPNAEQMNETVLNLPLHQNLGDDDLDLVVESVHEFFKGV